MASLDELVPLAIAALGDQTPSTPLTKSRADKFDVVLEQVIEESALDPNELRISMEGLRMHVRSIFSDIEGEDDPLMAFRKKTGRLTHRIESEQEEYSIYFPIAFSEGASSGITFPLEIDKVTFRKYSRRGWNDKLANLPESATIESFLGQLPTLPHRESPLAGHKFWVATCMAVDREYAFNRTYTALQLLLGQINFSAYFDRLERAFRPGIWRYGLSPLMMPQCYILYKNNEYESSFTSSDYAPRHRFNLIGGKRRRFEAYFPEIPPISRDPDSIDSDLMSAFQSYQDGITEPDDTQAFLRFWNTLEAATLTDANSPSREVLERASSILLPEFPEVSDGRIELLKQKRNLLVHGNGTRIEESDVIHLKSLADRAIWFLITEKDNYSREDLIFLMRNGHKSPTDRANKRSAHQRKVTELEHELELLNQIDEWLDGSEDR